MSSNIKENKKRIMVIFTGGTIGSAVNQGFISTSDSSSYKLIDMYNKLSHDPVEFDSTKPYTLLSENLNGEHINKLVDSIKGVLSSPKSYDGIIVTHGTDTLQYSAAALSFIFRDIKLPIVLVSSNYILDDERANGLDNFYFAVEFIKMGIPGVFVAYRNTPGAVYIHRGERLLPHLPCQDEIYSIGNSFFGVYEYDLNTKAYAFVENKEFEKQTKQDFLQSAFDVTLSRNCPVLYIKAMPGFIYPNIPDGTIAILFDSYHSGTLSTDNQELIDFTKKAGKKNIPIFLTGAENRTAYESTKTFDQLNIKVLPKASPIAMYVKLWILSNLHPEQNQIEEFMFKSFGKEFV